MLTQKEFQSKYINEVLKLLNDPMKFGNTMFMMTQELYDEYGVSCIKCVSSDADRWFVSPIGILLYVFAKEHEFITMQTDISGLSATSRVGGNNTCAFPNIGVDWTTTTVDTMKFVLDYNTVCKASESWSTSGPTLSDINNYDLLGCIHQLFENTDEEMELLYEPTRLILQSYINAVEVYTKMKKRIENNVTTLQNLSLFGLMQP